CYRERHQEKINDSFIDSLFYRIASITRSLRNTESRERKLKQQNKELKKQLERSENVCQILNKEKAQTRDSLIRVLKAATCCCCLKHLDSVEREPIQLTCRHVGCRLCVERSSTEHITCRLCGSRCEGNDSFCVDTLLNVISAIENEILKR
ncbi:hypothetical protein BgiMline_025481, partial [Biomphalaria glabrata]